MFSSKEINILNQAFEKYSENFCKNLPSNDHLQHISFSDTFENTMQKLIKKQNKSYYLLFNTVGKRIAAVLIAILVSLTVSAFSVKAIREPVIQFIVETFEKFSKIVFIESPPSSNQSEFKFNKINPTYIPDGFNLEYEIYDNNYYALMYAADDGTSVVYTQQKMDGSVMHIDTQNSTYQSIYVNDIEAILYINKGEKTIVFSNEEYVFTVSSVISEQELLFISESVFVK